MIKKTFRKLILGLSTVFMVLSLTGCGSDKRVSAFIKTDLQEVIASRVNANKDIAKQLCTSGLITDDELDTIVKSIDKQMGAYMAGDVSSDTELSKKLLASIVDWSAPAFSEKNSLGYKNIQEWYDHMVTRYIADQLNSSKSEIPLFKGAGQGITPLPLLDGKTGEEINERFGYEVFVLKPFSASTAAAGNTAVANAKSLDEALEMVSSATKDKNAIDNSVLDQLFQVAKDENGAGVTLLDLAKRKNRVSGYSIGSKLVSDSEYTVEKGKIKESVVGNKVLAQVEIGDTSFHTPDLALTGYVAQPGNDMVVFDSTHTVPLLSIRFNEFNKEAVDGVVKTLGMNPDQYLFTTYNGQNRVYIMEYPINYIKDIKDKDGDATQYESVFERADMGLNLRTGKLIKYGTAWGKPTEPGQYFESSDPYLSVKGAANAQDEGQSAFIMEGETPDGTGLEVGEALADGTRKKVKTGRIVLRDYLEATYAPGVVGGENMVVFGRKIRILQTMGSKTNVMARYYDKEGKVIADGANLYIDDFADFDMLNGGTPSVAHVGRLSEIATMGATASSGKVVTAASGVTPSTGTATATTGTANGKTICIDPGHGDGSATTGKEALAPEDSTQMGIDGGGAQGVTTKQTEGELNWAVAGKLKTKLEAKGFTVKMTKSALTDAPHNKERALAGDGCAMEIRIHADGDDNSADTKGASMLVPGTKFATEAKVSAKSKEYGTKILASYLASTGLGTNPNYSVKERDDLIGFNWSNVPVCLVEMGFLSNSAEDSTMKTDDFRDKAAQGLADGIEKALGTTSSTTATTTATTATTSTTATTGTTGTTAATAAAPGTADYATESIKKSLAKIASLKVDVATAIQPTTPFPGTKIGKIDVGASTKPLFYAIAVRKNMFDSALFGGWINNSDTKKNSLDWWTSWLENKDRTYQYKINKNSLEQYLMGNYKFELQKAGIIVLDLETINKIQQEYVKQDKNESMRLFRTAFVILGYLIVCYAFTVLIAWVVDVNVDLGLRILEKISFGHWVAVRELEEAPYADIGERKYVTFKIIVMKAIGVATVGILLVLVNIVDVVVGLITIFGDIAKTVGKLITGI